MWIFKRKKEKKGESILQLKPSTYVEVRLIDDNEAVFYSKLVEVLYEKEVIIMPPRLDQGGIVKLSNNKQYKIKFKTNKGIFENVMKIVSYDIDNGIPILKIKFIEPTIKIQKREGFRLNVEIEFEFYVIKNIDIEKSKTEDILLSKGKTLDISNGGLKFISNKDIELGDNIKILLNIEGILIETLGNIIYKEEVNNKEENIFSYKCRFENIPQKYKEEISKYIFDRQRELLKKGKISKD